MPTVRRATLDDIPALKAIDHALKQRADQEIVARAIADGRVTVSLGIDDVVGYLRWSWFWDKWPMSTIARVHPEHQRQGHGRALYAAVEQQLKALGCAFWLTSTEEDNARSIAFHEAIGFHQIGSLSELEQPVLEVFLRKDIG